MLTMPPHKSPPKISIRLARLDDAASLPHVEKSAAELFTTAPGLEWLVDGTLIARKEHERLILRKTVWVAEAGSIGVVGFINAEVFGDELHLWEVSVNRRWQRMGIGKRLISSTCKYATTHRLVALTLTTFADVPWGAPAYLKLGFRSVIDPDRSLQDVLNAESLHGFPMERRLAMRLTI